MLVLIYSFNGRYRHLARYYLLFSIILLPLSFILFKTIEKIGLVDFPPGSYLHFILWNILAVVFVYIGALALTPGSVVRSLTREGLQPFLPESILPQEISVVHEDAAERNDTQ